MVTLAIGTVAFMLGFYQREWLIDLTMHLGSDSKPGQREQFFGVAMMIGSFALLSCASMIHQKVEPQLWFILVLGFLTFCLCFYIDEDGWTWAIELQPTDDDRDPCETIGTLALGTVVLVLFVMICSGICAIPLRKARELCSYVARCLRREESPSIQVQRGDYHDDSKRRERLVEMQQRRLEVVDRETDRRSGRPRRRAFDGYEGLGLRS